MIQVTVQGSGSYTIPSEKVQELLNWLARNNAARVSENNNGVAYPGKELLRG